MGQLQCSPAKGSEAMMFGCPYCGSRAREDYEPHDVASCQRIHELEQRIARLEALAGPPLVCNVSISAEQVEQIRAEFSRAPRGRIAILDECATQHSHEAIASQQARAGYVD